jgi:hypothetical protein
MGVGVGRPSPAVVVVAGADEMVGSGSLESSRSTQYEFPTMKEHVVAEREGF